MSELQGIKTVKVYELKVKEECVPIGLDYYEVIHSELPSVQELSNDTTLLYTGVRESREAIPIREFKYSYIPEDKRHRFNSEREVEVDRHYIVAEPYLVRLLCAEDKERIADLLSEKVRWWVMPWYKRVWSALTCKCDRYSYK